MTKRFWSSYEVDLRHVGRGRLHKCHGNTFSIYASVDVTCSVTWPVPFEWRHFTPPKWFNGTMQLIQVIAGYSEIPNPQFVFEFIGEDSLPEISYLFPLWYRRTLPFNYRPLPSSPDDAVATAVVKTELEHLPSSSKSRRTKSDELRLVSFTPFNPNTCKINVLCQMYSVKVLEIFPFFL